MQELRSLASNDTLTAAFTAKVKLPYVYLQQHALDLLYPTAGTYAKGQSVLTNLKAQQSDSDRLIYTYLSLLQGRVVVW